MIAKLSVTSQRKSRCNFIPSPNNMLTVLQWHCSRPASVKSKCAVFLHCLSVSFSHLKIKQATMCETGKKSQSFIKTDTRRLNVLFSLTSKSTGSLCFLALT